MLWIQQLDGFAPPPVRQQVAYLSQEETVLAGRKSLVELHFRVAEDKHVNSHEPGGDLLVPTTLILKPLDGVRVESVVYPKGELFVQKDLTSEKLMVFSADFVVKAMVIVGKGQHTLHGTLRYQACDGAMCYPAKELPVEVLLTGR